MKKNIYFISIILILICISIILYILLNQESSIKNGTATVINAPSFKSVVVEIKDDKNNVIGESDIYSNVFRTDDKAKVEYTTKGKDIIIKKIEYNADTKKARIVSNISDDVTIRKYREMMKGYIDISNKVNVEGEKMKLDHLEALPYKISNQYYNTVSPSDFFDIKKYNNDGIFDSIEKDLDITITCTSNFKILSLENINDNITEEVSYKTNDKSFTLKALGYGIYSVKIEFDDGNIINYIFM